MTSTGDGRYAAAIPGQPHVTRVDYYVEAVGIVADGATDPPQAPAGYYGFWVAPRVVHFEDRMELGSAGWTHGPITPGFGDQWHLSTGRNHTPEGTTSWKCGETGGGAHDPLLDAGLVTPPFNLGADASLHYWQWLDVDAFLPAPDYTCGGVLVEISAPGGEWTQIFPNGGYTDKIKANGNPVLLPTETEVFAGTFDWHRVEFDLSAFTGPVQLRFRFGTNGISEREGWYVDDVVVEGFNINSGDIAAPELEAVLVLTGGDPNPFTAHTQLRYSLPAGCDLLLQVFDLHGRLVRTLARGPHLPGAHVIEWDGCDEVARRMPSGMYLTCLQAGDQAVTTKLILTR
jgi:hypothetical protein